MAWSDNGTKPKGWPDARTDSARVIQYLGAQYQSVAAATAEAEKVWENRTKMGGPSAGRLVGRVYEKLAVWRDLCCAGTISVVRAPHKKIHFSSRKVYWKSKDIYIRVGRQSSGISLTWVGKKYLDILQFVHHRSKCNVRSLSNGDTEHRSLCVAL